MKFSDSDSFDEAGVWGHAIAGKFATNMINHEEKFKRVLTSFKQARNNSSGKGIKEVKDFTQKQRQMT